MGTTTPAPDRTSFSRQVTRAVTASQLLFSAGNVLTTGGFLYYYADAFGPSAFQFSFLLILPELAESVGFLARPLSKRVGSRKRTWLASLLTARLFALGVPLMAAPVLTSGEAWPFEMLAAWVAGWYVLQGIAYACFISWLSDLMPQTNWGRLFARREIAMLGIKLVIPVAVGILRREWADSLPDEQKLVTYVSIFVAGNLIVAASVFPMWRLPDQVAERDAGPKERRTISTLTVLADVLRDRSFRWILLHSWWLSLAQGLTQSAFFKYQTSVLRLPVETFYVLNGLMLALQLPLTAWAGRLSDRERDKPVLFWSVTAVSGAMVFWLAATPGRWWLLTGAYVVWGLFGFVNVCGLNLMLKLAPHGDNTAQISLFRQMGGLCAALAGLAGGWWLDRLTSAAMSLAIGEFVLGPYQIVFLASFLGRATAGLWVLPIRMTRP
ncbi:MAG: MFS transporter [Planctomycetaceae bacterium]